jgi:hypothetical protein
VFPHCPYTAPDHRIKPSGDDDLSVYTKIFYPRGNDWIAEGLKVSA